ncbi:MAG: adenylyltransferase/cytidyltransferase family protein, partial [Candidatus Bathyarchaeia archaeon]
MDQRLRAVTVGGTFDVMHKGHWFLLEEAFEVGEKVIIGITTDEFACRLKKPHRIDCFDKRVYDVKKFLNDSGLIHRTVLMPLEDPYGPAINENEIEGII